jgi:hypothetical protein
MDGSYYDVAQICLNGHIINQSSRTLPDSNKKRCSDCGAPTIVQCQHCNQPIRGYHWMPGVVGFGSLERPPAFCQYCDDPFPWTETRLEAARDLANQLGLDIPERTLLEKSIGELVRDTPGAPAEAVRFKGIIDRAQPWALGAFKEILIGIVSESVKKIVWPGN